MGQIFSWFRGSQDTPALQDVAVEQQVTLTHSEISVRSVMWVCMQVWLFVLISGSGSEAVFACRVVASKHLLISFWAHV